MNVNAQNPIQEFNFNGTLNNAANTTSFIGTNNFVADRMGAVNGAQRLVNKAMETVVENLRIYLLKITKAASKKWLQI